MASIPHSNGATFSYPFLPLPPASALPLFNWVQRYHSVKIFELKMLVYGFL